jgi:subfamily B ATP-binding cassette protein MsbA
VAHPERIPRSTPAADNAKASKKKEFTAGAWEEERGLIWIHRKRLSLGLLLMLINRLAGFVLPASTKYLMDDVVAKGHWNLLPKLAMAVGAAAIVDALSSFANSQILGVAAQRAITDMRKDVEAHVMRLPIRYFDSTKSGVLISRIMTDAEGIRNLVGTGLVQLTGSILTATIALGFLIYLNWKLTVVTLVILVLFGGGMATAFKRLRPLFRERGQINAEVTGRLAESLGGVRIVKAYTAEKREELVFAQGAHRLFRNVAQSLTGVSSVTAFSSLVIAAIGIAMMLIGGSAIRAGQMTIGDFFQYFAFTAMITMPVIQLASIGTQLSEAFAGLDRIREIRRMAPRTRDADRAPAHDIRSGSRSRHHVRVQPACRSDVTFTRLPGRRRRWSDRAAPAKGADQPRHDVQPAAVGSRRGRPTHQAAARTLASCSGQLSLRRHDRTNIARRRAARIRRRPDRIARSSSKFEKVRHLIGDAACACRAEAAPARRHHTGDAAPDEDLILPEAT